MGWKKTLASIAPFAAFAIPGVGPALGGVLKGIGAGTGIGANILRGASAAEPIIGGIAAGRNQGKQTEGSQRLHQDDTRARMYDTVTRNLIEQAGLGRDKARLELDAPTTRMQQSVLGGLFANMPEPTGRLASSLPKVTPEMRSWGTNLSSLASSRMGKDTFDIPNMPAPPTMQGLPESNWLDRLLGVAGPATSLLGLLPSRGREVPANRQAQQLPGWSPLPKSPELDTTVPTFSFEDMMKRWADAQDVNGLPGYGRPSSLIDPRSYGGTPRPGAMY